MIPAKSLLDTYEQLYDAHDFFMFMVYPNAPNALLFTWDRTTQPVNTGRFHYTANDCIFNKLLNCMAIETFNRFPQTSTWFIQPGLKGLEMDEHVEHSYLSLSPIKIPLTIAWYIEEEIALPFEHFVPAFNDLLALYTKYDPSSTQLASLITCRFGPPTAGSYLSPCYGRKTAYITINIINGFTKYEDFFHDFETIMQTYGGRPHWGKFHYLTKEKIKGLYDQDHINQFNALRKHLDPHNIFANNFIKRCFD